MTLFLGLVGYILFSNPRSGKTLQRQGRQALWPGIAGFLVTLALWWTCLPGPWTTTPDYSVGCLLFQVLASWNLWCWLIVVLALGLTLLNFKGGLLTYGNVASFPFYLLHFPIVVVIAYYVLPLHMNIVAAFVCISCCAFLITLTLTELLFMRLNDARMLFRKAQRGVVQPLLAELRVHILQIGIFHREIAPEVHLRFLTGALK